MLIKRLFTLMVITNVLLAGKNEYGEEVDYDYDDDNDDLSDPNNNPQQSGFQGSSSNLGQNQHEIEEDLLDDNSHIKDGGNFDPRQQQSNNFNIEPSVQGNQSQNFVDTGIQNIPITQGQKPIDIVPIKGTPIDMYRLMLARMYQYKPETLVKLSPNAILLSSANDMQVIYNSHDRIVEMKVTPRIGENNQVLTDINKINAGIQTLTEQNEKIVKAVERNPKEKEELGRLLFNMEKDKDGNSKSTVAVTNIRNLMSEEFKFILLNTDVKYILNSIFSKLNILHKAGFRVCFWDPKTVLIDDTGYHVQFVDLPHILMNGGNLSSCHGRTNPEFPLVNAETTMDAVIYDIKAATQLVLLAIFRHMRLNPTLLTNIQLDQQEITLIDEQTRDLLKPLGSTDLWNTLIRVMKKTSKITRAELVISGFSFFGISHQMSAGFFTGQTPLKGFTN